MCEIGQQFQVKYIHFSHGQMWPLGWSPELCLWPLACDTWQLKKAQCSSIATYGSAVRIASHRGRRIVWHASSGPQLNVASHIGRRIVWHHRGRRIVWHALSGPQLNVAQNCGPFVPSSWPSLHFMNKHNVHVNRHVSDGICGLL